MIPPRCLPSDLNLQGPVYGIEFREEVWQELGRLLEAYLGRVQPIWICEGTYHPLATLPSGNDKCVCCRLKTAGASPCIVSMHGVFFSVLCQKCVAFCSVLICRPQMIASFAGLELHSLYLLVNSFPVASTHVVLLMQNNCQLLKKYSWQCSEETDITEGMLLDRWTFCGPLPNSQPSPPRPRPGADQHPVERFFGGLWHSGGLCLAWHWHGA